MKKCWRYFIHVFRQSSCGRAVDSCRVIEAMIPMVELYGVTVHDLPTARLDREPR